MPPKEVAKLRILDPACGSGSFLIRAYERVMEHYVEWFMAHPDEQRPRFCYKDANGDLRLTTALKRQILTNNIFGVDIDGQAVEVTQLSLYLRMLQGETKQTMNAQREFFGDEPILPPLDQNIKQGNSLIASDFSVIPDDLIQSHAFDWDIQFREVIQNGGFDAVIGNPPYNALLTSQQVDHLRTKFKSVVSGRADSAAMFVELATNLTRRYAGMLLPYRLFSRKRNHGAFQEWFVTETQIERVLYLGCVREIGANDEFMICTWRKDFGGKPNDLRHDVAVAVDATKDQVETNRLTFHNIRQSEWGGPDFTINIRSFMYSRPILDKMRKISVLLGDIAESRDGIVPHIRDKLVSRTRKDKRYKPLVGIAGHYELDRYYLHAERMFICYDINEAKKFIRKASELRKVQLRDESIFLQPEKILTAQDSVTIRGTIDRSKLYHTNSLHSTYLKPTTKGYRLQYVLGLLNSKLVNYFHDSMRLKGTDLHPQVLVTDLRKLPIRAIDFDKPGDKAAHDEMVALVDKMLTLVPKLRKVKTDAERRTLQNAVDATDRAIDQLVYKLYGLTAAEIKIVEGAS